MSVEPGTAGSICVPVGASLRIATDDYPEGLVLVPDEPVVVRLRFTDDQATGQRILDIGEPTLIRFPGDVDGKVTVNPVGPSTALQVCRPPGSG